MNGSLDTPIEKEQEGLFDPYFSSSVAGPRSSPGLNGKLETEAQKKAMTDWVDSLAPWKVIAHHTFVWEASIWSAQKSYERFMAKNCKEVSHFYALEENPGRDGHHVHALWADCEAVQRREIFSRWFALYGRNRIEPVRSVEDVASYCSKYVTKAGAWWNVKLVSPELWHARTKKRAS